MVEDNSQKVGESIKLDPEGMVTKKIIYQGDEGATPEKGQEVMVNYTGRLEDGTIFDSSQDKEALKVVIGVGQVIKGWDIGIMSMKLGEKAELTIKSDFAYGAAGSPPQIPGGATLIFDVELIQVNDRRPTRWMMSDDELIKTALRLKDDGNEKFKAKLFKQAEGHYKDALQHADTVKNDTEELKDLKVKVLQNMSVCTNNTNDFKDTILQCSKAIKIDATATKAWYLRSVANLKLNNFDEAATDCKMAVTLNPSDVNLRNHYKAIGDQKKAKQAASKKAMAAMFAEGFYNDKEAPKVAKTHTKLPDFDPENSQVFFDLAVGTEGEEGYEKERVVFELFTKQVPKTAENFRALCTGEKGQDLHYKGNKFHRIIAGFMMQGGDTTAGNGTGGKSIYGEKFEDEQIWYPHTHKGVLSMANAGPNTNGSQFFICYGPTPHLNEKHTIYGRVISGYSICEKAENVEKGAQDKPLKDVQIVDCGELTGDQKLSAETADFLANYN